jgi:Ca2+-binding RTX toxin-like protein
MAGSHTFVASDTNASGLTGSASLTFTLQAPTSAPTVTEKLANDTGSSATDKITSSAALTGTADANALVHFTVDGTAIAATTTANSSGVWSYTPSNLADGSHTIVASETNAAGLKGSASLAMTLETHAPTLTFTGDSTANGQITVTGTTGEAGDSVSIYDGNSWVGWATTGSNGHFNFTTSADTSVVHTYGANATNLFGMEGHGTNMLIQGTAGGDKLSGTGTNDVIVGGGSADTLTAGAGKVTFVYKASSDSTSAGHDTITDFRHGVDKIDFTNIAGVNATGGVPQFQGNITGTGNLTLNAHSVAYIQAGGNTQLLVNTSGAAETVTTADTHAADMKIVLVGVNLGVTASDLHHA